MILIALFLSLADGMNKNNEERNDRTLFNDPSSAISFGKLVEILINMINYFF